jgi:hypothetical protein
MKPVYLVYMSGAMVTVLAILLILVTVAHGTPSMSNTTMTALIVSLIAMVYFALAIRKG